MNLLAWVQNTWRVGTWRVGTWVPSSSGPAPAPWRTYSVAAELRSHTVLTDPPTTTRQ